MPKGERFSEREKGGKQNYGVREKKKENGCRCYNTNRKSRMNKERGMTAGVLSAQKIQQDFIVPSFHEDTSLIHEVCRKLTTKSSSPSYIRRYICRDIYT